MCYTATIKHKDINILISNCFGVGFDWNEKSLKEAIENRDEKMWEILDWMVNGGAELYNKAECFIENTMNWGDEHAYRTLSDQYEIEELNELLKNPYLSKRARDLINSFFDGSLRELYQKERNERKNSKPKLAHKGIIYLLKSGEYYKIGKTKNLPSRIDTLAVGVRVPFDIQLVHSFKSNDYSSAEAGLHKTFDNKRTDGEWFALSPEDVEFICSLQDGML